MKTAQLNGTTIAYTDTGGDLPPVILSHGFLMDHSMFDAQAAALSATHRVITWDERGFGGTRATGDFTYWDSANDVLALMDHLGIGSSVVGGMSQGGFLSLRVALSAPERVTALILLDTQAGTEDPATVEPYNQLHAAWVEHGSVAVQDVIAGIILGPGEWTDWYDKWSRLEPDQFTAAFRCLMHRDDITDRLGEITCPALIVHGTADVAISMEKAEILRANIAGPTTLVAVDGGPHAANMTHPAEVNEAILRFLAGLS
ncbi:MAG: alpha/beta fold hydrolase [Ilumatobacteraceae bacterium]